MENQQTTSDPKAGFVMGVISLVLGILCIIVAWIPCIGGMALIPAIVAIILGAVAYMQANKAQAAKGMIIAALAISVIAASLATWRYFQLKKAATDIEKLGKDFGKEFGEEFEKEMKKSLDAAKDSMK